MGYIPPFNLTNEMVTLVSEIIEMLASVKNTSGLDSLFNLSRVNRIKSIHASLAIEQNTLSLEKVTDIINGKSVEGFPNEIQEVKNAIEAYKEIENVDPLSMSDLLKVHGIMMKDLLENAGLFRLGQVGIFDGDGKVVHLAPPGINVPNLVGDLFNWLKITKTHPLIKSCVFHYEFEFIHPFSDGNGRMGRLWQTVILTAWKPIFAWIPVESMIKARQQEYYAAIRSSTSEGSSNPFIIFMLKAIYNAVKNIVSETKVHIKDNDPRVSKLLEVLEHHTMSATEIMTLLKLKSRVSFRNNYLNPAIKMGLIGLTHPDTPTNKNQRYFKN